MPSHGQKVAIALCPKFTAALSICGSLAILVNVGKRGVNTNNYNGHLTTRHRLLAGLSVFDLASSVGFFLTTWPIPRVGPSISSSAAGQQDEEQPITWVVWNMGNQATCNAQGFLTQLAIGTVVYNACLALYYLLLIWNSHDATKSRHIKEWIETRLEPIMHLTAMGVAIGTSTAALLLSKESLFNPTSWDCWIVSYPLGCAGEECVRGKNAATFQLLFNYAITWVLIPFVAMAMMAIFLKVKAIERNAYRWQWSPRNGHSFDTSSRFTFSSGTQRQQQRQRQRQRQHRQQQRQSLQKMVATQGCLYVGSMLVAWGFISVVQIYRHISHHVPPWWAYFVGATLLPTQGLFNSLVYFYAPLNNNNKNNNNNNANSTRRYNDNNNITNTNAPNRHLQQEEAPDSQSNMAGAASHTLGVGIQRFFTNRIWQSSFFQGFTDDSQEPWESIMSSQPQEDYKSASSQASAAIIVEPRAVMTAIISENEDPLPVVSTAMPSSLDINFSEPSTTTMEQE